MPVVKIRVYLWEGALPFQDEDPEPKVIYRRCAHKAAAVPRHVACVVSSVIVYEMSRENVFKPFHSYPIGGISGRV